MMNWLQKNVIEFPQKLFIQDNSNSYSFLEFADIVACYSKGMLREGIRPEKKILICLPASVDLAGIILACFEVGAIAVPISHMITKDESKYIIDRIQPDYIVTNWTMQDIFGKYSAVQFFIEEFINSSSGCGLVKNSYIRNNNDICAIILTSGTTKKPKAVQLTYNNFISSCENWNKFLKFKSNDQFLCCLPLHHIGGLAVLIRALIYGFSINLVSKFDSEIIISRLYKYPVSIISLVPTMLKRIIRNKSTIGSLKSLRYILLGGGPCHKDLLDLCIRSNLPIVKVYGMTETCSGTFGLKVLDEPEKKLYAGRPFDGVNVCIKNDEIHISGPMVMKGYLGDRDTNGMHNSKDLGRLDGNLLFLHIRRKDLIVSGGENINPIEIEENLLLARGVEDAAVIGKDDNEWGQKVIAYIVCNPFFVNFENLSKHLQKTLSNYKIPKEYIIVDNIPRNELGKIIYEKLRLL